MMSETLPNLVKFQARHPDPVAGFPLFRGDVVRNFPRRFSTGGPDGFRPCGLCGF